MVPVENAEGPSLLKPKGRAAETNGSDRASGGRHPPWARGCGVFTLLSSVTAAVSGFLVGYELGLISGALLQIRTLLALTCHEQEMVVSSLLVGALLASLVGGVLIDKYGRRAAIILSSCLLGLGSLVLILSLSYTTLIVGRIAIGVSISLSSIATCVYIAEIAPQHRRGLLVSLNELMIVIGILFAYISNYAFANVSHGWKYMFGLVIPLGVLQAIAMYFLPPSPRFLVMKGHEEAASKVLGKLRAISDTTEELTVIKSSLKDEYQYSFWDLFRSKDNMRARVMIGLTLVFFVQVTGQPNILFYASTVLKSVGFQSNEAASLASTGVGVVKVISTIPATLLVDHVGSKTFLCVGSSVMAVSLVTMGTVNLKIHVNFTNICRHHSPINQSLDESVFYGPGNLSASNDSLRESFKGMTSHSRSSLMPTRNDMDKRGEMTLASSPNAGLSQTEYQMVTDAADVPAFLKWLSLASLLVYVAAFSIGLGPKNLSGWQRSEHGTHYIMRDTELKLPEPTSSCALAGAERDFSWWNSRTSHGSNFQHELGHQSSHLSDIFDCDGSHWPAVGVLYIYNHESSIPGFCYCVHTRDKGMLFGTNINGAGKRELCEKQHLFYESSPRGISAKTASKKKTPRTVLGV
ncbi:solute carrier family 2, facilitated glucose transporter member 12 isoform X1 [Camelus dromedarius]|uniref:solute carrier family 2, facilitated glucose transporter member 12 isoform X1 n=1 Tax=Camelus dromedarius TaxID=9838 RepID=UPI001262D8E2|nr:solute carrier family 2, facilitated glucose transporter member 12 isoform X3 [Camelus dromedarius]